MTEHEPFALSAELIDEAVADLHSIHDWLRFAVSQFNAADVYFGHGTDNPWDDAGVLMAHVTNNHGILVDVLAVIFVVARVLYLFCYWADLHWQRSVVWVIGLLCSLLLMLTPAL